MGYREIVNKLCKINGGDMKMHTIEHITRVHLVATELKELFNISYADALNLLRTSKELRRYE